VIDLIHRVADSDAIVLIQGESGTGKELVARALHDASRRRDRPFVAINCAAVPAGLLESELFGHVKGAFTDARRTRPGLFVQAAGGTILLDEIGDMPPEMQVKLLRVLQERRVRPVGGEDEVEFDARVIAATNRDLEADVADKRFREDLYYRVNVVQIALPPLRVRPTDVLMLAHLFIQRIAARSGKPVTGVAPDAARLMLEYDWPGNVRELENTLERAIALTRFNELAVVDLPDKIRNYRRAILATATGQPDELIPMAEVERRYFRQVLAAVGGNKTAAARVLGVDRRSVYRVLGGEEPA
jgi:transcriptional regulator with PAS, ATPase and Fis domain